MVRNRLENQRVGHNKHRVGHELVQTDHQLERLGRPLRELSSPRTAQAPATAGDAQCTELAELQLIEWVEELEARATLAEQLPTVLQKGAACNSTYQMTLNHKMQNELRQSTGWMNRPMQQQSPFPSYQPDQPRLRTPMPSTASNVAPEQALFDTKLDIKAPKKESRISWRSKHKHKANLNMSTASEVA